MNFDVLVEKVMDNTLPMRDEYMMLRSQELKMSRLGMLIGN